MDQIVRMKAGPKYDDWWSKLTDGILTAVILTLAWLVVALAIHPIEVIFGQPGLLVYVFGLLAVSMFSLQQALVPGRVDTSRAWYGIAGGFLAWSVVEVTSYLGVPIMPNLAGIVLLVMAGMITGLLWRNVLPTGVRFFSLTFLLNWAEPIIMRGQELLAQLSPVFRLTYRATGIVALIAAFYVVGWILFRSHRRIQRMNGALALWFLVSLALYVFRGALF